MSKNVWLVLIAFMFTGCTFLLKHPEDIAKLELIAEEAIDDELGLPERPQQPTESMARQVK
jgi:hypothetical protein